MSVVCVLQYFARVFSPTVGQNETKTCQASFPHTNRLRCGQLRCTQLFFSWLLLPIGITMYCWRFWRTLIAFWPTVRTLRMALRGGVRMGLFFAGVDTRITCMIFIVEQTTQCWYFQSAAAHFYYCLTWSLKCTCFKLCCLKCTYCTCFFFYRM